MGILPIVHVRVHFSNRGMGATYSCTSAQPKKQSRERRYFNPLSLARLLNRAALDARRSTGESMGGAPMLRSAEKPHGRLKHLVVHRPRLLGRFLFQIVEVRLAELAAELVDVEVDVRLPLRLERAQEKPADRAALRAGRALLFPDLAQERRGARRRLPRRRVEQRRVGATEPA